jgi:hypothetical protein
LGEATVAEMAATLTAAGHRFNAPPSKVNWLWGT